MTRLMTPRRRVALGAALAASLFLAACSSGDDAAVDTTETVSTDELETETDPETEADDTPAGTDTTETETTDDTTAVDDSAQSVDVVSGCTEIAALFTTDGSANADLPDPESSAVCDGDTVVVTSNGIPDYPYVETSPGPPAAQDLSYEIPAEPTVADETTDVPLLGALGVTLAGIPIYGPTEGTGGDVGSIDGILMDCGSHNGPTGFHLHLVGTSDTNDCDFTPDEIASGPQLLGYAFDGYPIYTGNDQYTSSWQLTDESLFASDTWAAHTYVEGSGDLDECNGLTDTDGNYAYYTTDSFPYVLGCFVGEVDIRGRA
ncbi:MAG: YHYH protein [Ilumatobacter fluminis]